MDRRLLFLIWFTLIFGCASENEEKKIKIPDNAFFQQYSNPECIYPLWEFTNSLSIKSSPVKIENTNVSDFLIEKEGAEAWIKIVDILQEYLQSQGFTLGLPNKLSGVKQYKAKDGVVNVYQINLPIYFYENGDKLYGDIEVIQVPSQKTFAVASIYVDSNYQLKQIDKFIYNPSEEQICTTAVSLKSYTVEDGKLTQAVKADSKKDTLVCTGCKLIHEGIKVFGCNALAETFLCGGGTTLSAIVTAPDPTELIELAACIGIYSAICDLTLGNLYSNLFDPGYWCNLAVSKAGLHDECSTEYNMCWPDDPVDSMSVCMAQCLCVNAIPHEGIESLTETGICTAIDIHIFAFSGKTKVMGSVLSSACDLVFGEEFIGEPLKNECKKTCEKKIKNSSKEICGDEKCNDKNEDCGNCIDCKCEDGSFCYQECSIGTGAFPICSAECLQLEYCGNETCGMLEINTECEDCPEIKDDSILLYCGADNTDNNNVNKYCIDYSSKDCPNMKDGDKKYIDEILQVYGYNKYLPKDECVKCKSYKNICMVYRDGEEIEVKASECNWSCGSYEYNCQGLAGDSYNEFELELSFASGAVAEIKSYGTGKFGGGSIKGYGLDGNLCLKEIFDGYAAYGPAGYSETGTCYKNCCYIDCCGCPCDESCNDDKTYEQAGCFAKCECYGPCPSDAGPNCLSYTDLVNCPVPEELWPNMCYDQWYKLTDCFLLDY